MEERPNTLFHETQRFNQWWLWVLILIPVGLAWYGAYLQLILKKPFGNNPASDSVMLIIWLVMGIFLPLLFKAIRLETFVRYDGIHVKFTIFHRKGKLVAFKDLQEYEIRTYSALKEYGGYGIRFGTHGKAYNVTGNKGMQLTLTGDKKFLIGTQKPEQFFNALDSAYRSFRG